MDRYRGVRPRDAAAGLVGLPGLLQEESGGWLNEDYILLALLVVATLLLVMRLRRRLAGAGDDAREHAVAAERRGAGVPPRRKTSPARGQPEVERLFVELQEFAREVEGRLDTKIAYLKRLIAEADRVGQELDSRIGVQAPQAPAGGPPAGNPPHGTDGGEEREPAGPRLGEHLDIRVGEEPGERAQDAGAGHRVLGLHEEGRPVREIAELVGLPEGEVELIINLHHSEKGRG